MVRLNLKAVEERVAPLGGRDSYDREFIFELLLAYGKPQSNVTRLRNGSLSVADDKTTDVAQKNVVYFKETTGDPLAVIDELRTSPTVVRYTGPTSGQAAPVPGASSNAVNAAITSST